MSKAIVVAVPVAFSIDGETLKKLAKFDMYLLRLLYRDV